MEKQDYSADIQNFFNHLCAFRNNLPKTVAAHIRRLRHFLHYLDHEKLPASSVTEKDVESFRETWQLNTKRYIKYLISISLYYDYLIIEEKAARNPIRGIKRPKYQPKIHRFYTVEEIDRLIHAPTRADRFGLRDRTILQMLYDTGMRGIELCQLTVADLDLEQCLVKVSSKKRQRLIPLQPVLVKLLEDYLSERRQVFWEKHFTSDVLFYSKNGQPLQPLSISHIVKKYAR